MAVGDRITITGNPGRRGRTMRLREVVLHDGTRLKEDSETSDYADDQERRNNVGGSIVVVQNWTEELKGRVPAN